MRNLLAISLSLWVLPFTAEAADVVINNGLAPPNPANVIDYNTSGQVYVRNVGCPPGWPSGEPYDPCPAPGAPTEVLIAEGAEVSGLHVYDSSSLAIESGGAPYGYITAHDDATLTMSGGWATVVGASESAEVTISGGSFGFETVLCVATDSAKITIVGTDFTIDGGFVPYGDLWGTGTLGGYLASGEYFGNVNFNAYDGTITLVPPPPPVPALPMWGYLALAGGLIAAASVVLRRRAA